MAKRPLSDEQALTICRTPKPTPAKMRKRVVLKSTVDVAANRRAEELRGALEALGATLEKRDPDLHEDWQRNAAASDEQLAELSAELFGGKPIPPELDVWFRWHDDFDALPIGTAIAWDRQYLDNSNFLTVKLAPGLWCGALSTSIHAAHRAIVGLAVRYPPLVWRDGEDGLYGVLRDRDVVRRMGSCAVSACASRVGSS